MRRTLQLSGAIQHIAAHNDGQLATAFHRHEPMDTAGILCRDILARLSSRVLALARLSSSRSGGCPTEICCESIRDAISSVGDRILRKVHEQIFGDWLCCELVEQIRDFRLYLANVCPNGQENCACRSERLAGFVPETAGKPERYLFACDLKIIMALATDKGASDSRQNSCLLSWHVMRLLREAKTTHGAMTVTLKGLSEKLGITETHLGRTFHRQSGFTFRDYLRAVRLCSAARFFRNTSLSSKQVAEQLGYADTCSLCREFRKGFGLSPGRFRQRAILE